MLIRKRQEQFECQTAELSLLTGVLLLKDGFWRPMLIHFTLGLVDMGTAGGNWVEVSHATCAVLSNIMNMNMGTCTRRQKL